MLGRSDRLTQLLDHSRDIWMGRHIAPIRVARTGFADLDKLLPGQGWPFQALIEILPKAEGIGELRLVLPALKQLCSEARDIVFVRPPHIPYPPALLRAGLPLNRVVWIETENDEDAHWAAEQTLREGTAGAVLLWSDVKKDLPLRRLQIAARDGGGLAFLYRSPGVRIAASPAALRLGLQAAPGSVRVEILKAQGGQTAAVMLSITEAA